MSSYHGSLSTCSLPILKQLLATEPERNAIGYPSDDYVSLLKCIIFLSSYNEPLLDSTVTRLKQCANENKIHGVMVRWNDVKFLCGLNSLIIRTTDYLEKHREGLYGEKLEKFINGNIINKSRVQLFANISNLALIGPN
ncbi:unnamed protein product [Didymodactylos carnosus]|uniref:Uncharacterized protein n=1 Tax=Didymodactylos carnosus TaxID=1234261 RepID=A0A815DQG1_9BILA|nr:unnamed protein product [Didymodactylos carnosus]CAF4112473.1 unnamed protein product [Didymodactylos carnosus]